MVKDIIRVNNLTKDYGEKRGTFNIDLKISKGEVFGYIGTNGSGKTTTIRNIMGFVKPDSGSVEILGYDSWKESVEIKKYVSYVPGEIAFPRLATGTEFLKVQAEYLGVKDFTYMNRLIQMLQLDPTANLKRMSKGMKQKTALVAALMGDKEILILDEPTTGLDPLMREVFLELIREEKEKGKTIFMSSQIIDELEEVCDKVAVINNGNILGLIDAHDIRHQKMKKFKITFREVADFNKFKSVWNKEEIICVCEKACLINIPIERVSQLIGELKKYSISALDEEHRTLEEEFKNIYLKGEDGEKR